MPTFLAGYCAPGGPLAKVLGILLEKQPLPGDQRSPWEFQKVTSLKIFSLGMLSGGFLRSWRSSGKSRRDFTRKTAPPWGPTIPLGISKSYLSKNLHLGDANISGGFLRSWRSSGKSRRDFARKTAPSLGTNDPPGNFKKLPLQKSSPWGCQHFWRVIALLEVLWRKS